jgi:hypothetical protein
MWRVPTEVATVDIAGDPYQRGAEYGALRRMEVQACLTAWIESLRAAGIQNPNAHIAEMLRRTQFLSAIREHCPDLLEEVRGIADGAEQTIELLLGAQLMDEEWAYRARAAVALQQPEKCSSVAVRAGDAVLLGQNMDLGGYTGGHEVLLHLAPQGEQPGALIFSISSMIALLGVNDRRIGVCVNSIPQLPASRTGLPVAFMVRKLLQVRTLAEAVELVQRLPHATSQHYLLADATSIRSFEASPKRVVEYSPPDATGVLHTNHPLAAPFAVDPPESINSATRLNTLRRRLASDTPDLKAVMAALSSTDDPEHPVSRTGGPINALTGMTSFTTGSMISELRLGSKNIESWVSAGPPSIHGYAHVSMPCARQVSAT